MTFRPIPARWFELVTTSAHVAQALEALARTGAVELEVRRDGLRPLLLPDLGDLLKDFREQARRYGGHWPEPQMSHSRSGDPRRLLEEAAGRLAAWRAEADPQIGQLEEALRNRAELATLSAALAEMGDDLPELDKLAAAGPTLAARLVRLPSDARLRDAPKTLVLRRWPRRDAHYLLAVGPKPAVAEIEKQVPGLKGQIIVLPSWLPAAAGEARRETSARQVAEERIIAGVKENLDSLSVRHRLAEALGDFRLMEWLGEHAGEISGSARLAHITGWSADPDGASLRRALDERGVPGLLRFLPEPEGADAPLILRNPRWARNFEMFARMLGMPARGEADPSIVLALVAPLLFGFMFGDVGQGLVLIGVGLAFGEKLPVLRLLAPGGVMAVVFGFLFGSVFCSESLIPALWLHPLHQPVTLLAVTLAGGVAIIALGLLIDAFQAGWRGAARSWWAHKAGLVFAYLAVLAGFLWPPALWGAGIGALWFVLGAVAIERENPLAAMGKALAELVEQLIQLLVNTVSFSRVGAFALAHAGLSAAVIGVAEALGGIGYWIVLLLGNALVLTLEGLVVGIQTTRLMLFEFFIRFLAGGGRVLKPLAPPPGGLHPLESLESGKA